MHAETVQRSSSIARWLHAPSSAPPSPALEPEAGKQASRCRANQSGRARPDEAVTRWRSRSKAQRGAAGELSRRGPVASSRTSPRSAPAPAPAGRRQVNKADMVGSRPRPEPAVVSRRWRNVAGSPTCVPVPASLVGCRRSTWIPFRPKRSRTYDPSASQQAGQSGVSEQAGRQGWMHTVGARCIALVGGAYVDGKESEALRGTDDDEMAANPTCPNPDETASSTGGHHRSDSSIPS
ncbi:uncharacterized protein PSFLO_03007 [Pseudozyma flocculosa]|uniref:Uncharacterized protein n=1 Tax=Pseudozyma flocculosa TaxID=84751 RepID=A0A5C3EZM2_9BASI|nr:uncharacterized protein PSFLO_03007 [Pseudozyma flocculosa]